MSDRDRLEDALHVINGGRSSGAMRQVLYALYLVALLGAIYGFTAVRGALTSIDPRVVDGVLGSWWSVAALAALGLAGAAAARWMGRLRGPAAPPLPYVDLVVGTGIDRFLALRGGAGAMLTAVVAVGVILGGLVGGGVWAAGRVGVAALLGGLVGGAALGAVLAWAWLAGQAARDTSGPAPARRRASFAGALRSLRIADLRRQAIRSTHIGGAMLAGDLRAVRLDVATPVTRARSRRLRPGPAWVTVARRDILGLRRSPQPALVGALSLGVAMAALAAALAEPIIPAGAPVVAMALAYAGAGQLAEGLRLIADNAGTPPLLGIGFRAEAAAHLLVPAAGTLAVGAVAGLPVTLALGGPPATWLVWLVALTAVLLAAAALGAFRGAPPDTSFVPEFGPIAMVYWYARPLVLAAVSGGLLLARGADTAYPLGAAAIALVIGCGGLAWGLSRARALELAHRL